MSRLVIVSNRVPLSSERGPRAGGLTVALGDALRPGAVWFGWSGKRSAESSVRIAHADKITYATIDLTDAEYQAFYLRFSNGALWPLLHYQLSFLNFRREDYEGYLAVNRRFADSLIPLLQPDDLIWVHDYQLIPLGDALRRRGVTNRIGFFLHIPFVPFSLWQSLPRAEDLLRAWCAYDVVGFHNDDYRRDFFGCIGGMLHVRIDRHGGFTYDNRYVQAIVDPVGIDPDAFAAAAVRHFDHTQTRPLAIGVDRLDYTKGLRQRFEAFARLLTDHPEHRRQINLLQIAARSREDLGAYQQLRRDLDRIVGDINGQFSEFDWTPLRYITRTVRRPVLAGWLRVARLGLVTPLRDGMNLVAKEFIAAQDPADPGVLILSQFAGAADDLTDALVVNPYDGDETADAMHRGMCMSLGERQERWQALRARVWDHTAARFCAVFLGYLNGTEGGLTKAQRGVVSLAASRL